VTLKRGAELRGCIGTFRESDPIYRAVAEMGRAAAAEDPRFPRVTPEEVPELGVEISVLSPLRPVADPAEVEVGRHGVCVVEGARRGVLLPQVAVEWGWDRETFLDQTCRKAGLPPDAWRHGAQILVFEAEVFGTADAEDPRGGGGEKAR
jgi:AmmeMemoRadiSam system protein A